MLFVGVILLLVAAVAAVDVIVQNTHQVTLHAFGHTWTFAEYWLLVVGVVIAVVALLGLVVMAASARSARRARRERRELARENARLNATRPAAERSPSGPTQPNAPTPTPPPPRRGVASEHPPQTPGGYDEPRRP
jgi:uncharacterized integral membrane protein